ncbi:MAG TPA: nitroreductase family protein [Actinophytocola sp.]|jgi:nitroreductase|uniref:Acg family FMN-binding oxidoreductase n=1 Tax=Actinophytocola sp. TaxID=1872138 RepID=UPI002DFF4439|nr:nitroreductase family protein [Actinophytocola sp.]
MSTAQLSTAAVVDTALRAAIRAPSPHNTQPWRFETGPRRVDLLLDRERVLAVADGDAREARLACGAALLNLRLAVHAAGRAVRVDLLPDRDRPDLLATAWIGGERAPAPEHRALAGAIERRASNRHPFTDRPVPARVRHGLLRAAGAEGGRLILLERPSELGAFAALLRRADHLQSEDPAYQAELRAWVAEHAGRADGVPRSAGGPRPAWGGVLALRRFNESTVDHPFERDPLVAILATPGDTALDQVRAGQALQRVLLAATVDGLTASFVSQPTEVPATRAALRELLGGREHAQTALRLGYGYPAPRTPRRGVDAVAGVVGKGEEP